MDEWHDAVLNECMAIECCYLKDNPVATLRCLIDWHIANEKWHSANTQD